MAKKTGKSTNTDKGSGTSSYSTKVADIVTASCSLADAKDHSRGYDTPKNKLWMNGRGKDKI